MFICGYAIIDFDRVDLRHGGNKLEGYMDKWIGIDEASEYLGVNKDTIRNWIKKESRIPAHKIGKKWKFKRVERCQSQRFGKSAI